jgi:hypothetical protein
MDPEGQEERHEVFERIPWETLERPRRDTNWLVMALAGAVAIGALAFSFVRSQPADPMAPPPTAETSLPEIAADPTPGTVATPMVVAEADLYAVDEERLIDQATSHAEWFAVEYFSFDGSEPSRQTLASLLPLGVPLPEAPEGTQVFVDWVGAGSVTEVSPLVYQVGVTVRSLVSGSDGGFTRQPAIRAVVEVTIGPDGTAAVTRPPSIEPGSEPTPHPMALGALPDQVREQVETTYGPVVGGEQLSDGGWLVVAMVTDPDGVTRPRTVTAP